MQWAPPAARQVRLDELAPTDRPEILAAYLHAARKRSSAAAYAKQARFHFRLDPEASLDEIAAVAGYYPVFRVASRR